MKIVPVPVHQINSLSPGKFRYVIFKLTSMFNSWSITSEIVLRWMPQDLTDDKSTLVQAMAWCYQATSHYLNQCWPRSMSPYGITRPQWVNSWDITCETVLRWVSLDLSDDNSTLVQVMAWCQATNHYLSHCWPWSMSRYGVIRPQWVNTLSTADVAVNSNV